MKSVAFFITYTRPKPGNEWSNETVTALFPFQPHGRTAAGEAFMSLFWRIRFSDDHEVVESGQAYDAMPPNTAEEGT
ncbi:MAG: hypothetical protein QGG40_20615 [Myxococcota bacterium]|jgi:hypothetical protein|nr:hypothetical protein [Myxococcota bacterium]